MVTEGSAWAGDTPFYLMIEPIPRTPEGRIAIDLDTPWHKEHADKLRIPSTWWLVDKKTARPVMAVLVREGDQPYFVKHHVGNLMAGTETVAFGLGKKCGDGTMVRNWLLPPGLICGGDDVDIIATRMLTR